MGENVYTVLLDMPTTIKAFVKENGDDTYTIVLNSRFSTETQRKAYLHELNHIQNNDYEYSTADINEIYAHRRVQ